jgi:hypothetical protein
MENSVDFFNIFIIFFVIISTLFVYSYIYRNGNQDAPQHQTIKIHNNHKNQTSDSLRQRIARRKLRYIEER